MRTRVIKTLSAMLLIMLLTIPFVPTALAAPGDPAVTISGNAPLYWGLIAAQPSKLDPTRSGIITQGELNALTAADVIYIDGKNDNNHNGNLTDDKLTGLDGIDYAVNVTKVYLPNNSLTPGALPFLDNLHNLKELDLSYNTTITDISSLTGYSSLESLNLKGTGITALPTDMTGMTSLYQLTLGGYTPQYFGDTLGPPMNITNLVELYDIPRFKTLDSGHQGSLTIDNSTITNISMLNSCAGITHLFWRYNTGVYTPTNFGALPNLYYLDLREDSGIGNSLVDDIANLPYIDAYPPGGVHATLCISATGITDVSGLSDADNLGTLYWQDMKNLTSTQAESLRSLYNLDYLISLDLVNDVKLGNSVLSSINGEDASHHIYLPHITTLGIGNCGITDLSGLTGKNDLTSIAFGGNKVTSIEALRGMTKLISVTMNSNYVSDLSPLQGKPINSLDCSQNYLDITDGSVDRQVLDGLIAGQPDDPDDPFDYHYLNYSNAFHITVHYDPTLNGTAPSKTDDAVYYGQSFTPPAITSKDPAYVFSGWDANAADGTNHLDVQAGSPASVALPLPIYPADVIPSNEITYTAVFGPASYTVAFDSQQGSSVASVTKNYGESIASEPVPSRTGYTFGHWYPTSACNTTAVTFPHSVSCNETLFAKWIPNTYTVTYHANNGTNDTTTSSHTYDAAQALKSIGFSRTGFGFAGWATSAAGAAAYSDGQSVKNLTSVNGANIDLYAVWSQNVFTVSFDAQGGSVGSASMAVTYNTPYGALPTPTRAGYSFAGWYTDGGALVTDATTVTTAADHTLHAVWQFMGPYLGRVDLSCGSWQKAFVKTAYSYKIRLGENDPALTLTPIKEYDGASMTIGGKAQSSIVVSPANGKSTTVKVVVKYLKLKKTYTFTVTRDKSSNNNLASLIAVGGTFDSPFDPADTSYVLSVDQNTKSVTIKAAAAAGKLASVSPASKKIALNNGDTKVVNITVKAQSGAKKTYTITVKRAPSADGNLKSLKISGTALAPAFNAGVANYTAVMPAAKSSITLSVKASGYKAVVYIDDVKRTSLKVALANGGSKAVHVRVVAQSGDVKDYYINVQRQ